jgi:hypothetical protein
MAEVSMAKRSALLFVLLSFGLGALPARAQNFLTNSSETINKGNFKISAFPTGLFGKNGAPDRWGGSGRIGYGVTDSFDVEAKGALFNGVTLLGGDAELWLLKGDVDFSVSAGGHKALVDDGIDSTAFDVAAQVTKHLTDRFELYGGTSVSFEWLDGVEDGGFTRVYLVPGVEYKISEDLDFVTEFGFGLNDDSPHYFGLGLALYIR